MSILDHAAVLVPEVDVTTLKKQTIGVVCKNACKGSGGLFENKEFHDCKCLVEFRRRLQFVAAGVPKKYWTFTLDNLIPEFRISNTTAVNIVENYIGKLPQMVDEGIGLFIQGDSGLAKSAIAYYIIKEALRQEVVAYAIRMSKLTELIFQSLGDENKRDHLSWIKTSVQLLLVEEVEKDFKIENTATFSGSRVNEFFGDFYDSQRPLLVTSNLPKAGLKGIHATNIIDRFAELIDVMLVGTSYRSQEDAVTRLFPVATPSAAEPKTPRKPVRKK